MSTPIVRPMLAVFLRGHVHELMLSLGVIAAWPMNVASQEVSVSGNASRITIVPRVSVAETFTDNALLSNSNRRSELVSQVSPGIRISSSGGRVNGTIDYSLTEALYANNTSGRKSLNTLTATGKMEAVDNWAFLDFSGNVGQQAISAFGTPTSGGILSGGNSTETAVFRLSPYLRGRLAGNTEYEARYSLTNSRSSPTTTSDFDQRDLLLKVDGGNRAYGLWWGIDASRQSIDYASGRATVSSLINARIQYPLNERWAVYVKLGHESNDYVSATGQQSDFTAIGTAWNPNSDLKVSLDKDSRGFTGFGVNWAPSKRTSLAVTREGRVYGLTHNVAATYRTPSTAWTFSDMRNATSSPTQGPGFQTVNLYDLLTDQFAAGESDPVKRAQYDLFLLANGIKPGATAVGGFLSSSVLLQRSQQVSFVLFGARSTLSLIATRSNNSKLDLLTTAVDDLLTSTSVVQNGVTANYTYRITGKSYLSLVATRQTSAGSAGVAGTSTRSLNVSLSTQLTREASASVGARRVMFDSATTPYSETAVTGSLLVQF